TTAHTLKSRLLVPIFPPTSCRAQPRLTRLVARCWHCFRVPQMACQPNDLLNTSHLVKCLHQKIPKMSMQSGLLPKMNCPHLVRNLYLNRTRLSYRFSRNPKLELSWKATCEPRLVGNDCWLTRQSSWAKNVGPGGSRDSGMNCCCALMSVRLNTKHCCNRSKSNFAISIHCKSMHCHSSSDWPRFLSRARGRSGWLIYVN